MVVPAAYLFGGAVTVSAAFVVIATLLALFRHEHRALAARSPSTRVRSPLALHDDIATGLGRAVAVAAAAITLVATNALIACGYGAIAAVAGLVASSVLGAEVPWWLLAMPAWLIVTLIGLGRAGRPEVVGQRVLPAVEVVLVVAVLGFLLAVAEPGQVGAATPAAGPGAVLVVAVLGLCGFGATLAPCAPGVTPLRPPPPRPVLVSFLLDPRTVVVTAGLLLAGVAWSVGGGAAATGPAAGRETILPVLDADAGPSLARVVGVVVVGSLFAAALAAHRAGTGHLFVLGHQRLLPAALARTGRRSSSPMVASGVQSLLTGAVIAVVAIAGLDPYRHLFVSVGFAGALGVLVLVTVTIWAALADAARRRAVRAVTVVAAVAASLALAGAALGSYLTFGLSDPYGVTLLAMYPLAAVVGLTWAALLRRRQPATLLERR